MKLVIQRVKTASVEVDNEIVGQIKKGILVFLGVIKGDTEKNVDFLVKKLEEFRIFPDEKGRMNKSIREIQGEILVVSQFTLAANGMKGRRPSFDLAAPPQDAKKLYEQFIDKLRKNNIKTETGIFGAYMNVEIVNDGPVTFILEK